MIRSIILKPWEVRALLNGATQIRRPIKPSKYWLHQLRWYLPHPGGGWHGHDGNTPDDIPPGDGTGFPCPYGAVGDTLIGKETWVYSGGNNYRYTPGFVSYRADGEFTVDKTLKWKSPATMPRWASRLSLTITGVRVQRMAEITQQDAKACGADPWWKCGDGRRDIPNGIEYSIENVPEEKRDYIHGYKYIWYDDYPAYPWESAWSWVIDCERTQNANPE